MPEILGLSLMLLVLAALGAIAFRSAASGPERLKIFLVFSPILMFCVCSIAWLIGGMIAIKHGGYTWNGKIENGVHYLRYKSKFTPVTEETWHYLEWVEGWTGGWTFAFGVFCIGALLLAAWIYNRNGSDADETTGEYRSDVG